MFLVRLEGETDPTPLKSAGDGMVRIFQVALALESAKNGRTTSADSHNRPFRPELLSTRAVGMLLVDEIENGIHYTVLPDLWRFIFRVAHLHNVQVFATTHSWDCVEAFQGVAARRETN